jgi:hypothetical protein
MRRLFYAASSRSCAEDCAGVSEVFISVRIQQALQHELQRLLYVNSFNRKISWK